MNKTILVILSALLLTVSCKKEDDSAATAAAAAAAAATSRDLFRLWTNANGAFTYDMRLGNLTGASFNAYVSTSSGDVCTCVTTITGSQSVGGYTSVCTKTTTATSYNCVLDWNSAAGANYTNNGSSLATRTTTNGSFFYWPN